MSELVIEPGQTVVFAGDSITDCGRREAAKPFGDGYVKMVIDLVQARYPEHGLRFVNAGISGNTVLDLRGRWDDDVLWHKPDWVSVKIGINDLHRRFWPDPAAHVSPETFESAYRHILERTRDAGAKLLLVDPFYISTAEDADEARAIVLQALKDYIAVVDGLGAEFGALRVKTHDLFQEQLRHRPADELCPEPVHPYAAGHAVIAHGVLQALGW